MRQLQFANQAVSKIAANIGATDTTLAVMPGDGAKFPALSGTQYFTATLVKASGTAEIVKVTARAGDTFTIVRAYEKVGNTQTALAFTAGDRVELRLSAKSLGDEFDRLKPSHTVLNKSANYTVLATDNGNLIRVNSASGDITITLPLLSSLSDDFEIIVAKVSGDKNKVTVACAGSNTINGLPSYIINDQYSSAWLIADRAGGTWTAVISGGNANGSVMLTDAFTGDGTANPLTLSGIPADKNATIFLIGGVPQYRSTYALSGNKLTPGATIPNGAQVEVWWWAGANVVGLNAASISYTPAGTGAAVRKVEDKLREVVSITDFAGCDPTGATLSDAAFASAAAAISNDGVLVVPPGTYLLSALTIGQVGKLARMYGIGQPTLKFMGVSSGTDCLTLAGYAMRQVELRNFIIDANNCGRDALVLTGSDHPIIKNVVVRNSVRDGFAIVVTGLAYVENGEFSISIEDSGRHGVREEISGSGDAFINEILWKQIEIRGVSKKVPGGNAIRLTSTATGAGSKFSMQTFIKTNFDAQYSGGPKPSLNVVECDSGIVESFSFNSGGWENTGAGDIGGGYPFAVSGTGVWGGLDVGALITNSRWGNNAYAHPSIIKVWDRNYSFGHTMVSGPLMAPTNPAFFAYQSTNQSNVTGDGTSYRLGQDGSTSHYNRHDDELAAGIFTTPRAGVYTFGALAMVNGMSAAHTFAELKIVVASGSTAAVYQVDALNPYANASGGNAFLQGFLDVYVDEHVLVYATVTVAGGAKTIGVIGGSPAITRFSGRFQG